METQGIRRLRLRRIGAPPASDVSDVPDIPHVPEEIIQKNLEPLKQYTEAKKRAQEHYYEKTDNLIGTSPMLRKLRKPVRQRLGRKVPVNGTSTAMLPPKIRMNRLNSTLNNTINKPRLLRKNYAQMRLNRIRERQLKELQLTGMGNLGLGRKPVRLRRIRVEVPNNFSDVSPSVSRHKIMLDRGLQEEIRQLQDAYQSEELILNVRFKPVTTNYSLNSRFSCLT